MTKNKRGNADINIILRGLFPTFVVAEKLRFFLTCLRVSLP
jgi:hypothetical protein